MKPTTRILKKKMTILWNHRIATRIPMLRSRIAGGKPTLPRSNQYNKIWLRQNPA